MRGPRTEWEQAIQIAWIHLKQASSLGCTFLPAIPRLDKVRKSVAVAVVLHQFLQ
jgi:hypothetical protein